VRGPAGRLRDWGPVSGVKKSFLLLLTLTVHLFNVHILFIPRESGT
jgi:hypothetical protein